MKKVILILSGLIIATAIMAQVPMGITHQAVMRDANNELLINQEVGVRVSILKGVADDMQTMYIETHTATTNVNGLLTFVIGKGLPEEGIFEELEFAVGVIESCSVKIEVDPEGGTNYTIEGISPLYSVPYALHAQKADEYAETDPLFMVSPAANITAASLINWDEAFSWGDHSLADYLTEETDPLFAISSAAGIAEEDINNWDEAFSWGDHDGLYRPNDWNPEWADVLSKPVFADVAFSGSYLDLIDKPQGTSPGEMKYWDGSEWIAVVPGQY